jgi:hypothetical protein
MINAKSRSIPHQRKKNFLLDRLLDRHFLDRSKPLHLRLRFGRIRDGRSESIVAKEVTYEVWQRIHQVVCPVTSLLCISRSWVLSLGVPTKDPIFLNMSSWGSLLDFTG